MKTIKKVEINEKNFNFSISDDYIVQNIILQNLYKEKGFHFTV